MVEAFVEALPGSVDEDALSNKVALNDVATGLKTAAAAFANLSSEFRVYFSQNTTSRPGKPS